MEIQGYFENDRSDINERLMSAAKAGSEVELKALLRNPGCDALTQNKDGLTALMVAAESGNGTGVQLLLPVSDALAKDINGRTALMRAACMGYEGCVKLLLPVSDALGKDHMGMTALMGPFLMDARVASKSCFQSATRQRLTTLAGRPPTGPA